MPDSEALSVTERAVSGVAWRYGAMVLRTIMQIGFLAVLARLLSPEVFGIVGMATLVMTFTGFFAQAGLGQALVQRAELDDEAIAFAFGLSTLLGVAMAAALWLAAPAIGEAFNEPRMGPVLQIIGLAYLFVGFSTTSLNLLRRTLDFRALAVIDVISYLFGYGAVGIVMAAQGYGVWSLAAAAVATPAASAAIAFGIRPHSLRPRLSAASGRSLMSYGARHTAGGVIDVVAAMADGAVVGRFLGASALGFYSRAQTLVNVPVQQVALATAQVLFAAISRRQDSLVALAAGSSAAATFLAALVIPLGTGVAIAAEDLVLTVLGRGWEDTAPVVRIFGVMAPFVAMVMVGNAVLDALARLNVKLALQFANLVLLFAVLWAVDRSDLQTIAFAVAAVSVLRAIATMSVAWRHQGAGPLQWAADVLPGISIALATGAAIAAAQLVGADLSAGFRLAAEVAAAGVVYILLTLYFPPRRLSLAAQALAGNGRARRNLPQRLIGRIAAASPRESLQ